MTACARQAFIIYMAVAEGNVPILIVYPRWKANPFIQIPRRSAPKELKILNQFFKMFLG